MKKSHLFFSFSCFYTITFFVLVTALVSFEKSAFSHVSEQQNLNNASPIRQISSLCETTKLEAMKEISTPFRTNPKTELTRQIYTFRAGIRKIFKREQALQWETLLMLDRFQESLRQEETDMELLDTILDLLRSDEPELKRPTFVRLKQSFEKNRPLLSRQNQQLHIEKVESMFDSLPGLIEHYLDVQDVNSAKAISEALEMLKEMCKTEELITLIRQLAVQPNLKIRMRSEVMAPLFLRDVDESVTVNDNILGTWVRGSGYLIGKSGAAFVPSSDSAVIRVTLQGQLNTATVGTNGPVRVRSNNATAVTTVKDIVITKDSITTTRASTDAKQSSQIANVNYTRSGPLVRMVAPNQIRERKPASEAESERLTKRRLNARVDSAVDENVQQFADKFTKMVACRGNDNGLRLQFDRLITTDMELVAEAVVGNRCQLTTMTKPPAIASDAGLFLQLHESLVANAGDSELGGKTLVEEQVMAELRERFPKVFENRETGEAEDEPSLTISFSDRPVAVRFADDIIQVTVETTAIERGENVYPAMVLEFRFRIETADNCFCLVAVGPPEVLPPGFDREHGQLSARETVIRAIVMKKLGRMTEKPIEWKETKIERENVAMTFKPVVLSAKDGWLSVGLDLIE